ncbi:type ISP restriction/modification enzyme [Anatilimnocola aggregata]|uniref:type ISP restriction/modification enzyme n=1 Tax=Anatilimnocola aggregata TaxID=2528021 RepID=UPI00192E424D|nr:type ISP restriction/modification enzyme [Anatilimnocola aggregata]
MRTKPFSLLKHQRLLTASLVKDFHRFSGGSADSDDASSAADSLAGALACATVVVGRYHEQLEPCWPWLLHGADGWTRDVLTRLQDVRSDRPASDPNSSNADDSLTWHVYELLLQGLAKQSRRSTGTFYTPPSIARFCVAALDHQLKQAFGLSAGLGDATTWEQLLRSHPKLVEAGKPLDRPFVQILEPACGSGVFLAAAIEHVLKQSKSAIDAAARLLPRLIGIDIGRVPLLIARLRIAVQLAEHGIVPDADFPQPRLQLGNALDGPENLAILSEPNTVILGNPPFSYLSRNEQPWIQDLIRGSNGVAGYFAIDDQQLGERKTWLHDDYVKFLRLSQWCIEQAGAGVISLVTNHGWLDNATFRIARQQLLRALPQIDVVDLHGNFKRQETSPHAERDENVFGLSQGIAIVTAVKSLQHSPPQVTYAELWGSRAGKLARLCPADENADLSPQLCEPRLPWFTFVPQREQVPAEYASAPLLTELMPVHSTVPVTARDHFVVARTREELLQRIERFVDPTIDDAAIRQEYFSRTRSTRYLPGDTRSWKLSAARQLIRDSGDPQQFIRRCLYRPFVWRYIFWHPAMIDWPRPEFTRHLSEGNLTLLARRQSLAGKECNFFWITDSLPLDGVIRSDNRGSESFFPLWLQSHDSSTLAPNFSAAQLATYPPQELLAYVYALFHSATYRTRYSAGLAMEFPRVLFPASDQLFASLASLGKRLIQLHLTEPHLEHTAPSTPPAVDHTETHLLDRIEAFQVGTYRVCRKWLEAEQATRESASFGRLQQLIAMTLVAQDEIEIAIQAAGGFPAAFQM